MIKMKKKPEKRWIKHVIKEGSRYHVLSYDTLGIHCNIENCEINNKVRLRSTKI